jgi:hypothetical protein
VLIGTVCNPNLKLNIDPRTLNYNPGLCDANLETQSSHMNQGLTPVEYRTQYAWHLLCMTYLQLRQHAFGFGSSSVLACL